MDGSISAAIAIWPDSVHMHAIYEIWRERVPAHAAVLLRILVVPVPVGRAAKESSTKQSGSE